MYELCMQYSLLKHHDKIRKQQSITEQKVNHLLNVCISKNKWFYVAAVCLFVCFLLLFFVFVFNLWIYEANITVSVTQMSNSV